MIAEAKYGLHSKCCLLLFFSLSVIAWHKIKSKKQEELLCKVEI